MNSKTVALFSTALREVLTESGFQQVVVDEPISWNTSDRTNTIQVSVSVGLTGDIAGFIMLQGTKAVAQRYAELLSLQMGVPIEDTGGFDEMHKAALAEFINQIGGRATIRLSEAQIDTDITPPTIVIGDSVSAVFAAGLAGSDIPVRGPAGNLFCTVLYRGA